jgi:hypothetical protein
MDGNRKSSHHALAITLHGSFRRLGAAIVLTLGIAAAAVAEPYGFGDIRLGTPFDELSRRLDFRDIGSALEEQHAAKARKPDLGRRGFGCLRGANGYADFVCVSHDESAGGAPTREVRLQFLDGMLQTFSITVEADKSEAVLAAIRSRYGAPHETRPAVAGAFASQHWRNADSTISVYRGKDLVFVSFELAGYRKAVERRQRETASTPP